MQFAGLDATAVFVAALASFVFGGVWYGALSKPWLAALGKTQEEIAASGRPLWALLILTLLAQLLMAWVLAGLVGHLGPGQVTVRNGLISAAFVWAGFVVTTLAVNHGYQGNRWALTAIDGAHWLGVLLIQGAIIGAFGVTG